MGNYFYKNTPSFPQETIDSPPIPSQPNKPKKTYKEVYFNHPFCTVETFYSKVFSEEFSFSQVEYNFDFSQPLMVQKYKSGRHHIHMIQYNYDNIKHYFLSTFGTELIAAQFHPKNAHKWLGWQIDDLATVS